MTLHSQSSALDLDKLKGKKKWRKPLFSMEEPAAPATQKAFAQKGNPLIPESQKKSDLRSRTSIPLNM